MTLITLPAPPAPALTRVEKPTPSAHALPAVATVTALPDSGEPTVTTGRPPFISRTESYQDRSTKEPPDENAPQAFSAQRFADPLPNLPELDLPAKAAAYQAALTIMRNDDTV